MYSVQLKISRSPSIFAGTTFVTDFLSAFCSPTPQPAPNSDAPSARPAPPWMNSRLRSPSSIVSPNRVESPLVHSQLGSERADDQHARPLPRHRRVINQHPDAVSVDRRDQPLRNNARVGCRGKLAALDALLDR